MAKKNKKLLIWKECEKCKNRNYSSSKTRNIKEKITQNKYCSTCTAHTSHKEVKLSK